jgi:hypothetical protein
MMKEEMKCRLAEEFGVDLQACWKYEFRTVVLVNIPVLTLKFLSFEVSP